MKRSFLLVIITFLFGITSAQDFYDINSINIIELTFEEDNWDEILDDLYADGDEERLVGDAVINGIEFASVGVRYKGNSSYNTQNTKNPLNIKLDHIINDQTYEGYGTLKLSNAYKDPTFVRETLSYEIARNYMAASLANYCQVYINDQYMGMYTNVQSVDKLFKNTHYATNNDIRFKGEIVGGGMPESFEIWGYLGADSTDYMDYYELKSDTGWDELIEFLDVFNNDASEMENYLNIDAHLWMLAFDNLMVNLDAPINYGHNYYLFQDGAELFNPIIWDLNECFGVFSMLLGGQPLSQSQMQHLDPLLNLNDSDYPIIGQVLNTSKYQKMYIAHMRTMIEEIFQSGWYETRAYELQDIIADTFQGDPNTFYTYSQFLQNVTTTINGGGPGGSVIGITQLMETRYEWLLDQDVFQGSIPELSNPATDPETIEPGTIVWLNVDGLNSDDVWLNYRFGQTSKFEEIEMLDDGNHNDGEASDGNFGISVTAGNGDMQYYFYAQNSDQGSFLPVRAAHEFYEIDVVTQSGNIVINEINYNSADDFNSEDWVELFNPGSEDVNISSWEFKDEDDSHIFLIPDNTILAAGEYLVLSNDLEIFSTVFPSVSNVIGDLGFGFSGSGELIRIFDAEGMLIDAVEYGDDPPWPEEADGNGATLELIDADSDNSLAENWMASLEHGTPGEQNDAAVSSEDDQIESVLLALSNYPNPFNPTTTISFNLKAESDVTLEIYNIKGQLVRTLVNDVIAAGRQEVIWNGRDDENSIVSSGIYFYKLNAGGYTSTKKMILLK